MYKKKNLKNEYNGKIKNIIKDKLCVKVNNYNVSINPDHYYIFVKPDTYVSYLYVSHC